MLEIWRDACESPGKQAGRGSSHLKLLLHKRVSPGARIKTAEEHLLFCRRSKAGSQVGCQKPEIRREQIDYLLKTAGSY